MQQFQQNGAHGLSGAAISAATAEGLRAGNDCPCTNELLNHLNEAKDGSESKLKDCPTGTLPIDPAKGKFKLDKDDVHTIKDGVQAGQSTWTGIAQMVTFGRVPQMGSEPITAPSAHIYREATNG